MVRKMADDPNPALKPGERKATGVALPAELVAEAEGLKINVSLACEAGLARAISAARHKRWLEANREAIDFWNRDAEQNGLPLDDYREF
jgi:antitoxin CcdA